MIILAWNGGSLASIFDYMVFKKILSIFITSAILNLGQGMETWHGRCKVSLCFRLCLFLKPSLENTFYFA